MKTRALPPSILLVAVLTGLAVPLLFFGRAVMAVPLLVAILIVVVWLPGWGNYWRQIIRVARTPVGLLFLITLALWVPGIIFSPFPLRSFEAWARIPVFVGSITLLWAILSKDHEALHLTFKVLLIASAIVVVLALASLGFAPEKGTSWIFQFLRNKWYPHRVSEILKEFSTMAILLMPVLLLAGRRLGARWPVLAVACAIGLLAIIWMTYNRAAMAGLLAMLIVVAGLMVIICRRPMVYIATSVSLSVVILAFMLWLNETRSNIQFPEGAIEFVPGWMLDYQRQMIWHRAFEFGMDAPWFGNGINAVNLLPGADAPLPRSNLNIIPSHPHNWLVEMFAETGAVGAISLVILVATLCFRLASNYLRGRDDAILAALLVNVGYWASGLLNFSFWSAWWQISYLLMTAICLACWGQRSED